MNVLRPPLGSRRLAASWALGFAIIVVFFLAVGWQVRSSVAATFDSGRQLRLARTLLFEATKGQLDEETGVRGFVATHDPSFLEPYHSARRTLPDTLRRLASAVDDLHLSDTSVTVHDALETNARWTAAVAEPLVRNPHANGLTLERLGKALVDRFRADVSTVDSAFEARSAALQQEFERDSLWLGALIATAAIVLFATALLFLVLQIRALDAVENERRRTEEGRLRERSLRAAYDAEKRVADTLQQAFAQRQLPALPTVVFSATYVPATEETKVGGDWYDAFEIGEDRILFTIGDIAGHGLEAAVAMSAVRNDVLSAALVDPDPASVLALVNQRIINGSTTPMVTAVIGVADAKTYEFTYATAGHPPPVLLEPGRLPRTLAFGGLPLGVSPKASFQTRTVQSIPGALLVLYTDGVVEHSRNLLDGEAELLDVLGNLKDPKNPAISIYRAIFNDKSAADDVAILTVGFPARGKRDAGVNLSGASVSRLTNVARADGDAAAQGMRRAS